MNIKTILKCVALFLFAFLIGLAVMFPYTLVTKHFMQKYAPQVAYIGLKSGLFSTTIDGLSVDGVEVGDVELKYTPLSAITRSFSFVLKSPYGNVDGNFNGKEVVAKGLADVGRLSKIAKQTASGEIAFDVKYNIIDKVGTASLSGGKIGLAIYGMQFSGDSVVGELSVKDTAVTVGKLSIVGESSLDMKGRINIDSGTIGRSLLSLTGDASIKGMNTSFSINGTVDRPDFKMN